MKNFKTTSLADQVYDRLENDIIQGTYPKGELITELKLVEQLGVSRTPIREALRRLEQERLIEDAGKGSRVVGITSEDVMDIMDIRHTLEGLAAYHATLNMTEDGLKELAHIVDLQDFYFDKWDVERLRRADDDFHETICLLSGRTVIKDTLLPLHRKTRRYRRIAMEDRERAQKTLKEHRKIYEAIVAGDASLAMELSSRHIYNAKNHMMEGSK